MCVCISPLKCLSDGFFPQKFSIHIQVETKVFFKELVNVGVTSVGSLKCLSPDYVLFSTHIHLFSTQIEVKTTFDHKMQICSHYLFW